MKFEELPFVRPSLQYRLQAPNDAEILVRTRNVKPDWIRDIGPSNRNLRIKRKTKRIFKIIHPVSRIILLGGANRSPVKA